MQGLTLLELLVVMLIVGLLAAMVGPGAARQVDAARARSAERQLKDAVHALPLAAFGEAKPLTVDAPLLRARLGPDWPAGWVVELPRPLRYDEMGAAEGGTVWLVPAGGPRAAWRVLAPSGRLEPQDAP